MVPSTLVACVAIAVTCIGIRADLSCGSDRQCENDDELAVELLQRRTGMPQRADVKSALERAAGAQSRTVLNTRFPVDTSVAQTPMCAPLSDEGASFTLPVQLGTTQAGNQRQSLPLIVDTGSNAMVVSSCECNYAAGLGSGCALNQPCFHDDPSVSPTFLLSHSHSKLAYGSGDIQCDIGSDYVRLQGSNISAYMKDGLYLIRDRHELQVGADFLGILGLGIPSAPEPMKEMAQERLFMEAAGVPRYSICFNGDGIPGALKTGMPPLENALTSTGVWHWGLGMNGLRGGSSTSTVISCTPEMPGAGTKTPCGIIPDSGTTQILGPPDQVLSVFESLCTEWPRCKRMADDAGIAPSADLFTLLLSRCEEWLTAEQGIHEVPSIFLDLVGANDSEAQTIELTAWSWVVQVESPTALSQRTSHGRSLIERQLLNATTQSPRPACVADIDVTEYPTIENGPIWILGEPLFFEGTINYDITSYPPTMSFEMDALCNCPPPGVPALLDAGAEQQKASKLGRTLRQTSAATPRKPKLNTSTPL